MKQEYGEYTGFIRIRICYRVPRYSIFIFLPPMLLFARAVALHKNKAYEGLGIGVLN